MIILYIPFYEENDLIVAALSWKDASEDKDTLIIQHGDDINYPAISNKTLKIYILAHGTGDLMQHSFHLASNASMTKNTTYLDIEKIADRFNSDFTYVHTRVKNIKLYFCNNKGNQKSIAERFNKHLGLFSSPIDYYAGTLFSPFANKKKYAHYSGQWYLTSKVRSTVYRQTEDMELNYSPGREWWEQRIDIKERTMLRYLEDAKQKRIDAVLKRQHEARHKIIMSRREGYMQNNDRVDDIEPSPSFILTK